MMVLRRTNKGPCPKVAASKKILDFHVICVICMVCIYHYISATLFYPPAKIIMYILVSRLEGSTTNTLKLHFALQHHTAKLCFTKNTNTFHNLIFHHLHHVQQPSSHQQSSWITSTFWASQSSSGELHQLPSPPSR